MLNATKIMAYFTDDTSMNSYATALQGFINAITLEPSPHGGGIVSKSSQPLLNGYYVEVLFKHPTATDRDTVKSQSETELAKSEYSGKVVSISYLKHDCHHDTPGVICGAEVTF